MEVLLLHESSRITPSMHKRCIILTSKKESHSQHADYIFVPSVVGLVK